MPARDVGAGAALRPARFIHATTADRVHDVVASRYADLDLPLLDITFSVEALEASGTAVDWVDGAPRIVGELPTSAEVVVSERVIPR